SRGRSTGRAVTARRTRPSSPGAPRAAPLGSRAAPRGSRRDGRRRSAPRSDVVRLSSPSALPPPEALRPQPRTLPPRRQYLADPRGPTQSGHSTAPGSRARGPAKRRDRRAGRRPAGRPPRLSPADRSTTPARPRRPLARPATGHRGRPTAGRARFHHADPALGRGRAATYAATAG